MQDSTRPGSIEAASFAHTSFPLIYKVQTGGGGNDAGYSIPAEDAGPSHQAKRYTDIQAHLEDGEACVMAEVSNSGITVETD